MIKGCTKRVIVAKDLQSDIFEEAYFILRPQGAKKKGTTSQSEFLSEANRIVCEQDGTIVTFGGSTKKRGHVLKDVLIFISGVMVTAFSFILFI